MNVWTRYESHTNHPKKTLYCRYFLYDQLISGVLSHQVGLFRKSGNKSRIQILRERVDLDPDGVSFDHQSAFDVADLIKQYLRDLPEPVFSSRLSDTFLHVYQCE